MTKKFTTKITVCLLAGAMCLSAVAPAAADVYYAGGAEAEVGPGVSLDTQAAAEDAAEVSLDAADYAATGGVAAGSMSISSALPSGTVSVAALEIQDPVVQTADVYTYDYMFHDMDTLSQKYPSLMSYRSIGKSRDGREIYEMILGKQSAGTHIMVTAAIHAREWITTNLVMKQAEFLLYSAANHGSFDGKRVSDWFNEVCVHIVPMVNPDGVSISQFGESALRSETLRNTLRSAYSYDLMNQRTSYNYDEYCLRFKANAAGVDLNQNFNAAWANASGKATQASYSGFKGTAPETEPETKALTTLYNARRYKAVLNYHAMGDVIYWDIAKNKFREHSRDLANNLHVLTGYQMLFSAGGGGFKDYVQLSQNASTSVTIEVGKTKAPVPWTELEEIYGQNKFALLYTMKWARDKGK